MATFNNIIQAFRLFATNHKQINTFFSGAEWDFETKTNNLYPAIICTPDVSNVEIGRYFLKFNIFFVDIVKTDISNVDEIYSDMLQVVGDFIAEFNENLDKYGFTLEESVQTTPVNEEIDDNVCGWMINVAIQLPYNSSDCGLPLN